MPTDQGSEKNGRSNKTRVVQLTPSLPAKLGRIYSNFMQISHSPWDITIRFCDAPPGGDIPKSEKDTKVEIPTLVEIVMSPEVIPGLIKALSDQKEKYEKVYGKKNEAIG